MNANLRSDSSLAPKKGDVSTYAIKTTFLLHGQPLVFSTGVHVVRPVEIGYTGQRLLPGREEQIRVSLRNRLDRDLEGTLTLAAHPDLQCAAPSQPLLLPAKSWTECVFAVTANTPGVKQTRLICEAEEVRLEHPLTFRALPDNGVLGSVDAPNEYAVLESRELHIGVNMRGGGMSVSHAPNMQGLLHLSMPTVGPPFTHGWLRKRLVECRVESASGGDSLIVTEAVQSLPNLQVERRITLLGNVARLDCIVRNSGSVAVPVKVRIRSSSWLKEFITAPLVSGLIREPMQTLSEYPMDEHDILAQGATLAENWIACEGEGMVSGLVFEGSPEQDMEWTELVQPTYDLGEIPRVWR